MLLSENKDVFERFLKFTAHPELSTESASEYLVTLFQSMGLQPSAQPVIHSYDYVAKRQYNVIGVLGDKLVDRTTPKGLLFVSPFDSLEPAGEPVYARLALWCALEAVQSFREKPLKQPVYIATTCGSAIHDLGTRYLVSSKSLFPNHVIVGAMTDNKIEVANKSLHRITLTLDQASTKKDARGFSRGLKLSCKGLKVSSAFPKSGVNAIHELMDYLLDSAEHGFELKIDSIAAGGRYSLVPDQASATFFLTPHQFEDYRKAFEEQNRADQDGRALLSLEPTQSTPHVFMEEDLRNCSEEIRLKLQAFSLLLSKVKDEQFNPPHPTLVLTELVAKGSQARLRFDLRLLPDQNAEEVIRSLLQDLKNITLKYPRLNAKFARDQSLGAYGYLQSEFTDIAKELAGEAGLSAKWEYASLANETSLFKQANYKTLGFGPGSLHKPLKLDRPELVEAMQFSTHFYELMIERLCL